MNERTLENHIGATLEKNGWTRVIDATGADFILHTHLDAYLKAIQSVSPYFQKVPNLKAVALERWKRKIHDGVHPAMLLKGGVQHEAETLHLLHPDYRKNRFAFQLQFHHDTRPGNEIRAVDLMLWVNGLPLGLIELKNETTGQTARTAVEQILKRVDDGEAPGLFRATPFLMAMDTNHAYLTTAAQPKRETDFRHFDPSAGYYASPTGEYGTFHIYGDFWKPDNLTQLFKDFIYQDENQLIFPRFHQWETVRYVAQFVADSYLDKILGDRILLQHSAGSGKSKTIAWLCQFLRGLLVGETREPIVHKLVVVTDRVDLDKQLQKDLGPILGKESVRRAEDKDDLAKLLMGDVPVVITTVIHKFLNTDFHWRPDRRVAIIIDEAHRSQEGEMHESMRGNLEHTVVAADADPRYVGDDVSQKIGTGSNAVLIALTATPTAETLRNFGKDGKPHHVYSMRQAIAEGYIIDVLQNVITYDTIYQLQEQGGKLPFLDTYPAPFLSRICTWAAYESEDIIEEKARVIAAIIRTRTQPSVGGRGRALLTCVSRKAAATYQKVLAPLLAEFSVAPLVAYSDADDDVEKEQALNRSVGANATDDEEIKGLFRKEDRYRILVVASKFQTGFDEPLLHTLFIDKPVKGVNAVQTLSRLNRVMAGKDDTLVVDFTNSYEEIAKAFTRFLGKSEVLGLKHFTVPELKQAFQDVLTTSGTDRPQWEVGAWEGLTAEQKHAEVTKQAARLHPQCGGAYGKLVTFLEVLGYFHAKGLFVDDVKWVMRKFIAKTLVGMFHPATGHYSADGIKESIRAIGVATQLIELSRGAIAVHAPGGGNCEPQKPKEVKLAEVIAETNAKNLAKLETYRSRIQDQYLAVLKDAEAVPCGAGTFRQLLEQFEVDALLHLRRLQGTSFTDYLTSNPDLLINGRRCEEWYTDIACSGASELFERYLRILQEREKLIEAESKLYSLKTKMMTVLQETADGNAQIATMLPVG